MSFSRTSLGLGVLALVVASCSSDDGGGGGGGETCPKEGEGFAAGDPAGHADPFGAKASKQARAGRVQRDRKSVV